MVLPQVQLENFGKENITRFCESASLPGENSTCLFTVLNLEEVSDDATNYIHYPNFEVGKISRGHVSLSHKLDRDFTYPFPTRP